MRYINFILGLTFSTLLLVSCSRDKEVSGPKYISAGDDIVIKNDQFLVALDTIIHVPATDVVFGNPNNENQKDTVYFYAELSKEVTWKITISGLSSGAEKVLLGTSSTINHPYWTGESDNTFFFRKDEQVAVTLSFVGSSVTQSYSLGIAETKLFENVILLTDFEEGSEIRGLIKATAEDSDGWFQFFDVAGEDEEISYGLGPGSILVKQPSKSTTPVESVQGKSYFHLRGDDNPVKPSPFFIGGFGHDPVLFGIPDTIPAEEIFMNLYLNSNGNTTTKFIIEIPGINGDLFIKEFTIDWEGWQQVSFRLSDFVQSQVGENGIGKLLPSQIKQVKFAIHSSGIAGNVAEANVDFVTFSFGSPFKQN